MNEQTSTQSEQSGPEPSISFLDRLANHLGPAVQAGAVFGAPVERDGITIIPVAKARWGMGGGAQNQRERTQGQPMGGGAGVMVKPVGYIAVGAGKARFCMIPDSTDFIRLAVAGGFFGLGLVNTLGRLRAMNRPKFRPPFGSWRRLRRVFQS